MRVVRVSPNSFANAVRSAGKYGKFIRIPSSVEPYMFASILMADGAWIAWPDNLTPAEEQFYVDTYGEPPDLFELKAETAEYLRIRNDEVESGKTT